MNTSVTNLEAQVTLQIEARETKTATKEFYVIISLHTLMGHIITQKLKVLGHVNGSLVVILVDSGSTHNFIQDCNTKFMALQVVPTQNFHVLG